MSSTFSTPFAKLDRPSPGFSGVTFANGNLSLIVSSVFFSRKNLYVGSFGL